MRTDEKLAEICENLRIRHGDLFAACRAVGLSANFVQKWMKDDEKAAAEIREAQHLGYMSLESVLIDRAVHGVEEEVWHRGEVVGTKTVRSDALLVKAVEARVPAYNKRAEGGGNVAVNVQIANIMPRAENYSQWLEMKTRTLSDRAAENDPPRLSVGVPEILQGDYVVVQETQRPLAALAGLL